MTVDEQVPNIVSFIFKRSQELYALVGVGLGCLVRTGLLGGETTVARSKNGTKRPENISRCQ